MLFGLKSLAVMIMMNQTLLQEPMMVDLLLLDKQGALELQ
jgi:hypothetical protein